VQADSAEGRIEIGDESLIRPVNRGRARNQDIIRSRLSLTQQDRGGNAAQTPLRTVASYGVADPPARGEPYPYDLAVIRTLRPPRGLQHEARSGRMATASRDTQKIGANLQSYKSAAHRNRGGQEVRRTEMAGLGGQTLTALRPPCRQHPTPSRSCHTCPEAMAALANEFARLVSALHGAGSEEGDFDRGEVAL
jgi:hypothetical protein